VVVAVCGQWSWLFAVVVALKVGRLCDAGEILFRSEFKQT